MPYFLILPVFLILEVLLLLSALAACFLRKTRWVSGYLMAVFFGSTLGTVIANEILWHSPAAPVYPPKKFSVLELSQVIIHYLSTFSFLQWPFVASGAGFLTGSALGVFFVYRKRQKHP